MRIWHSASIDGVTFDPLVETMGLGDSTLIAYPSVVSTGNTLRMWFTAGGIHVASSTDGVHWELEAERVWKADPTSSFYQLSVLYPSVRRTTQGWEMWFTGYDGAALTIGRAQSLDGLVWELGSKDPVLRPGNADEFDNRAVAQPSVVEVGGKVYVWYGGYDTSKTDPGPYRIGSARVVDGTVVKSGVALDFDADGNEGHGVRDPSVVRWHDQWWLAYAALGVDNRYRVKLAVSSTCP